MRLCECPYDKKQQTNNKEEASLLIHLHPVRQSPYPAAELFSRGFLYFCAVEKVGFPRRNLVQGSVALCNCAFSCLWCENLPARFRLYKVSSEKTNSREIIQAVSGSLLDAFWLGFLLSSFLFAGGVSLALCHCCHCFYSCTQSVSLISFVTASRPVLGPSLCVWNVLFWRPVSRWKPLTAEITVLLHRGANWVGFDKQDGRVRCLHCTAHVMTIKINSDRWFTIWAIVWISDSHP